MIFIIYQALQVHHLSATTVNHYKDEKNQSNNLSQITKMKLGFESTAYVLKTTTIHRSYSCHKGSPRPPEVSS
jgi:hypothetical protein